MGACFVRAKTPKYIPGSIPRCLSGLGLQQVLISDGLALAQLIGSSQTGW